MQLGRTSLWLLALIPLTSLIAACGGNEETATADVANENEAAASDDKPTGPTQGVIGAGPLSPSSIHWGRTTPCDINNTGDFLSTGPGLGNRPLVSRHVACARLANNVVLQMSVMPRADGKYVFCATQNSSCRLMNAVNASLVSYWQVYGDPGAGAWKDYELKIEVGKWSWDPAFSAQMASLPSSPPYFTAKPIINCSANSLPTGSSTSSCTLAPAAFTLSIPGAYVGAKYGPPAFRTTFNWGVSTNPAQDFATFQLTLEGLSYTANGNVLPPGQTAPTIQLHGTTPNFVPDVRCDRKVTGNKAGSGCVLPAGAAVFVLDSADTLSSDISTHIRSAQTTLQPGMTSLARGVYAQRTDSRAEADPSASHPSQPFFYDPDSAGLNRGTSCENVGSLYNTRTYVGSVNCPTQGNSLCNCDEFPMAATFPAGFASQGETSVRGVLASHNSKSGGDFSAFLTQQRIVPMADPFYVFVK
jgi:hypothetical protein